jgi:hypothetical protein
MSYCRFSSDNFRCDAYVYAHVDGGYVTHVAGRRYVNPQPLPELPEAWHKLPPGELTRILEAQEAWRDAATLEPIGLPHDGEQFVDDTPGECADRLEFLAYMGYNIPQSAIDALRTQQTEDDLAV